MVDLVLSRPGLANAAEAHWSEVPPLGLGYLAAAARARGLEVRVIDGRLEKHGTPEQTVKAIGAYHPEFVGISALTIEFPRAAKIALGLKGLPSSPLTVLGGAHANALPKESLLAAPGFDYVMAGECEGTLPDLIEAMQGGRTSEVIPGLYARDAEGSTGQAIAAGWKQGLSEIPFPAWDLFPRVKTYPLLTERGCPYHCVFCSRNLSSRVRSRSVDDVMEEIKWLKQEFAPASIYIEDETFGLNSMRTEELLLKLIEFNRNAHIRFKAQTRVDCVTRPLARLMKTAGFDYLELGVESGDSGVLTRAGKGITVEQSENAVRIAREEGIRVWLNFIIGLPGETRQTLRRTIELAVRLNPDRLSVATIVAYPGSQIYDWARAGKNGYRLLSEDWGRFDKYLASSVELENLRYPEMRRAQVCMYLEVYLRNGRCVDLAKLFWKNRSVGWSIGRSCLRLGDHKTI